MKKLTAGEVMEIDSRLRQAGYARVTEWVYAGSVRQILRWLWEDYGAPKLDGYIERRAHPRPRSVTVGAETLEAVRRNGSAALSLWLLLCSDMAIRSGTAVKLGPENYDPRTETMTFITKFGAWQRMQVTKEIAAALRPLNHGINKPYVAQLKPRNKWVEMSLREELERVCKRLGMVKTLRPHDLRRTTAVKVYEETGDIRQVQSLLGHGNLSTTLWYLDHEVAPVRVDVLEAVKHKQTWKQEGAA